MAHPQRKKMAHQKRAHSRKLEHLTSVLHDGCRTVSLEASPCSLKHDIEDGKVERGIVREAGGALGKSRNDKGSTKDIGEASVEGRG
jgi:hypothetical protein